MVIDTTYTMAITTNMLGEIIQAWKDYDIRLMELSGTGTGVTGEAVNVSTGIIGNVIEKTSRQCMIRYVNTEGYDTALTFDNISNWMRKNRIMSATISKLKFMIDIGKVKPELITFAFEGFTAHTRLFRRMLKGEESIPNQELIELLNQIKKEMKNKYLKKRWRPSIMLLTRISPKHYSESYESMYSIKLPRMSIFKMKSRELVMEEIGLKRKGG